MDKCCSICTYPAFAQIDRALRARVSLPPLIAPYRPSFSVLILAFRIVSLGYPNPNRFYAGIQGLPSGSSPTSIRKSPASLRRASGAEAAHTPLFAPAAARARRKGLKKGAQNVGAGFNPPLQFR